MANGFSAAPPIKGSVHGLAQGTKISVSGYQTAVISLAVPAGKYCRRAAAGFRDGIRQLPHQHRLQILSKVKYISMVYITIRNHGHLLPLQLGDLVFQLIHHLIHPPGRISGLVGENCHIINGHVPVKVKKGESPVKGGGKLLVIDGGFSRAYQSTSGIAGYTLIYNSRHYRIVSHQPFAGKWNAVHRNDDIANESVIFEKMETRMRVRDTDEGEELQTRVNDLKLLLEAYRTGAVTENHMS